MLVLGKRILHARALIDPGSTGHFLNSRFSATHNLSLDMRSVPLTCTSFDGSPGLGGLITQAWKGRLSMVASNDRLFDSSVVLDVTTLGDYDLILGMPWLKAHLGWVGAAGPSLLLVNPVLSSTPSDPASFVSSSSSLAVDFLVPALMSLKSGKVPPFSNPYLLSKDEEAELRAYLDDQISRGHIHPSSSLAAAPIFFCQVSWEEELSLS